MNKYKIPLTPFVKGGKSDYPLYVKGALRWNRSGGFCSIKNSRFKLWNSLFLSRLQGIKVFSALIIISVSVFAFSACSTGAYPVDVFPEGHYQQSYRSQEPPRLQPPADSVPIGGREISYNFTEAAGLTNPLPATSEVMDKAKQIYKINCEVCHGPAGRGDGPMASYLQQSGASPPTDYTTPRVRSRKDGELYWIVTNGLGFMPRFGPLLTPEERWALVRLVRSLSGPDQ